MAFKLRQYSACIIDIVEDFLEEHNINIENDEKQDSDNPAIIYGTDYDALDRKITNTLDKLISDYNKNIIAAVVIDKDDL
jgi:hypothetical protein